VTNTRKWTEDDARWLKANFGRMDSQTLSRKLGLSLEDLEKKVRQLKLAAPEPDKSRKAPASLKEAVREFSAARKEYEKAIELFHRRHFDEAARRFEELIEKHPDEKEFLDRARMYLTACRNGKKAKGGSMESPEEIYHAAVFEKNRGNVEKALELLRKNAGKKDGDGRVHYLSACCLALQGDLEQALLSLRKAIAADDHNRIQARLEADLSALRGMQGFTELVAGGA
jgi:tetratricopeptide (TPR) repeat protein